MLRRISSFHAFGFSLILSVLMRVIIAAWIPMTGDEAYYVFWGKVPALGYYDQPPMVGWWLALLLQVSDAKLWLRLPTVLVPAFTAWVLSQLGSQTQRDQLRWAGALFALTPITIFFPAITTDVPLIFWVSVCVLLWFRGWSFWAGVALGAAFLSKYFSVLLFPAFLIHLTLTEHKTWRGALKRYCWMLLGSIWGPLIHLYWNSQNCWANFVFNLWVRNGEERFHLHHVTDYLSQQIYLVAAPWLVLAVVWVWRRFMRRIRLFQFPRIRLVTAFGSLSFWVWIIPTITFFVLAFRFGIGLHFILAFYPFYFSFLAISWRPELLRMAWFGSLILLVAQTALAVTLIYRFNPEDYKHRTFYKGYHQTIIFDQITHDMEAEELAWKGSVGQVQWLADGYSQAALLGFYGHRQAWVLGGGSDFGRQTDFVARWQEYAGRDFLFFFQSDYEPRFLYQYFSEVQMRRVQRGPVVYWLVRLEGFQPQNYQRSVLDPAFEKFYLRSRVRWGACPLYMTRR